MNQSDGSPAPERCLAGDTHTKRLGVELIVRQFGEEARAAVELHIVDDLGVLPESWSDPDDYFSPLSDADEEVDRLNKELFGECD